MEDILSWSPSYVDIRSSAHGPWAHPVWEQQSPGWYHQQYQRQREPEIKAKQTSSWDQGTVGSAHSFGEVEFHSIACAPDTLLGVQGYSPVWAFASWISSKSSVESLSLLWMYVSPFADILSHIFLLCNKHLHLIGLANSACSNGLISQNRKDNFGGESNRERQILHDLSHTWNLKKPQNYKSRE